MDQFGANKNSATLEMRWAIVVVLVLFVAMLGMIAAVRTQAKQVSAQQRQLVVQATQASYERELGQLVEVARTIIHRMADQPGDVTIKQRQVLAVLAELKLGQNGYFFVYDAQGRLMLDPNSMRLDGVDFCDPSEGPGKQQAAQLLNTAYRGGGLVSYDWQMPSSQESSTKVSYVAPADRWGWVIGTGIYLNDVNQSIEKIGQEAEDKLNVIFEVTLGIGLLTLAMIFAFYYGIHRYIFLSVNRRIMALRGQIEHGSEQTRERVAHDLHDGVLQVMASTKYLLETARYCNQKNPGMATADTSESLIDRALVQLSHALRDVRHLMHNINNSSIEQGLEPAIAQLLEVARSLGFSTSLSFQGDWQALPQSMQVDVYRMAQEAIANAQNHSGGDVIEVALRVDAEKIALSVRDNGARATGPVGLANTDSQGGMGVRNLRTRAARYGGSCHWHSHTPGVEVLIELPREGV